MNCTLFSVGPRAAAVAAAAVLGTLCAAAPAWAAFGDTDTSFGTSTSFPGFTITDLGGAADFGQDLVTGTDDRLYVLGSKFDGGTQTTETVVVTRYDASGALDTTFGDNSSGTLALITSDHNAGVHLEVDDANSRIYLAAAGCSSSSACTIDVGRFKFDGSLDSSYGTGGIASFSTGVNNPGVNQLLLQPDGKLLVLIEHGTSTATDLAVARLKDDGSIDTAFGDSGTPGRVSVSAGACDIAPSLMLGRSPRIYVTAATRASCSHTPAPVVTRLTAAGALDTSFGSGGRVTGNFGQTADIVALVAQEQPSGEIAYAIGKFNNGGGLDVDILVLHADGSRDQGFAVQSGSYTPISKFTLTGGGMFQTDGRLVFNGKFQTSASNADEGITRLQGSSLLGHPPRFGGSQGPVVPFVGFLTASAAVNEGAGSTTLTVTLSEPTTRPITVPFSLGGSATNGVDYTLSANSFVVPAGETTGSITVNIVNDTLLEFTETILVTLGTPTNASNTANHNTFIVQIIDNDLAGTGTPASNNGGALGLDLLGGLFALAGLRRRRIGAAR